MTLQDRIDADHPKRILSLDGGGIRGLITLGYLEVIEDLLREQVDERRMYRQCTKEDFRLRDYYDLIGGTSTGSIIATALAIGLSVKEITKLYMELGETIFSNEAFFSKILDGAFVRKFDSKPLKKILEGILGKRTLGSSDITTGLCIVAKRYDTNNVWPLVNTPKHRFYADKMEPNKDLKLADLVRASTAAPSYFDPEHIKLGAADYGFIDGGISMHNNPALQLFIVATHPNFGFGWKTGPKSLSIMSLGTGDWSRSVTLDAWKDGAVPVTQVASLLNMMMEDASALNETILQAIGLGSNRREIDLMTGPLDGNLWGMSLLSYERFQVFLDENFFKANGLDKFVKNIPAYREMDNVKHMNDLLEIGRTLGNNQIKLNCIP